MRPIRVECVGIPASGKSAACNALARELKRSGVPVLHGDGAWATFLRRRNDGVWKNMIKFLPAPLLQPLRMALLMPEFLRASSRRPAWVADYLTTLAGHDNLEPSHRHMLLFAFLLTLCDAELARGKLRPGEVWLCEEGLVQRAFSLFGYGTRDPDDDAVRAYLSGVDIPEALLLVETPVDICHERLLRRPFYPVLIERLPEAQRQYRWRAAAARCRRIAALAEEKGVRVLPVQGNAPSADSARVVASALMEIVGT